MKMQIMYEGEPILRAKAEPLTKVTNKVRKLVEDMFETMYADNGIGLAAPQVAAGLRVIVIDIQTRGSKPIAVINPEIITEEGEQESVEGCLSCPGLSAAVKRAQRVTVTGMDTKGRHVEYDVDGLPAIVFQHEIDHLDGILFIDRLTPDERLRVEQQRIKQL